MNRNNVRLLAALLAAAQTATAAPLARPAAPVRLTAPGLPLLAAPALSASASATPSLAPSVLPAPSLAPAVPVTGPAAAAARVGLAAEAVAAANDGKRIEAGGDSAHAAGSAAERALTGAEEIPAGMTPVPTFAEEVAAASAFVARYREQFAKAIVGQTDLRESLLLGLLSGGNILLEGVPGVAKTRAVNAIAQMLDLKSGRVQFTRDLMPSDITGQEEKDQKTGEWGFRPGPVFVDMLLADEINRAKGQTQSGVLEAMQEKAVTVAGTRHKLSKLFFVVATQNPIEEDGVYPLPKAQYDRFMFKVDVPNPNASELSRIVRLKLEEGETPDVERVLTRDELLAARELVRKIKVSDEVSDYIGRLVAATHKGASSVPAVKNSVRQGASPRAAEWLARSAQALAFTQGRHYVEIEDVQKVAHRVLRHRILLEFEAEGKTTTDELIDLLIAGVPVTVKKK